MARRSPCGRGLADIGQPLLELAEEDADDLAIGSRVELAPDLLDLVAVDHRHGGGRRRRAGEQVADCLEEGDAVDRLRQIMVHAGVATGLLVARHGVGGHSEDRQASEIPAERPDLPRRGQPVHLGHGDVHDDQVVGPLAHRVERFAAIADEVDARAAALQQGGGDHGIGLAVLGEQDAALEGNGLAGRRGRAVRRAPAPARPAAGPRSGCRFHRRCRRRCCRRAAR